MNTSGKIKKNNLSITKKTLSRYQFAKQELAYKLYKRFKSLKILEIPVIIDKSDSFFGDFEDYGYFQIFCKINSSDIDENLSNRCYTGFSKNNNNFSFVHGNSYVQANSMNDKENNKYLNLVKTSFIDNQNYLIQNNFESFDLVELFYLNPIDKNISLKINNEDKVDIPGHSVYKYAFKNEKIIKFKSDCCFLRPIVFCHKEQFIDVHHA